MTTSPHATPRSGRLAALAAVALLALSGCATTAAADEDAVPTATQAESVTVTDAWVKAVDEGMSAGFGILTNDGSDEVTVVAASGDASTMFELHETGASETGEMTMQQVEGGFVIAPGDSLTLESGGNHIMFMDVVDPLVAGDEVTLTLVFGDDSSLEFTAPVKDYVGANESYDDHSGHDDSEDDDSEHDHSEHDH